MIEDKPIDYEVEYNNVSNELVELRQKYSELDQDWKYIKSLLDVEFEKNIQLQKENEELKYEIQQLKNQMDGLEMAKEILATPTLCGSATKLFLDDMMRPDNDKEKEIKERIKKGNHIKFI